MQRGLVRVDTMDCSEDAGGGGTSAGEEVEKVEGKDRTKCGRLLREGQPRGEKDEGTDVRTVAGMRPAETGATGHEICRADDEPGKATEDGMQEQIVERKGFKA